VNDEILNTGVIVATKYPLGVDTLRDNITEIATLKYLQGLPTMGQLLGTSNKNAAGVCTAFPCVVMEKARSDLSERHFFTDWKETVRILEGVLRGFDTLHSSRIVHRDVKPGNILLSEKNTVQITDFGASRYTTAFIPPCQDGYLGTHWFSSPEVLLKRFVSRPTYSYEGWFAQDAWAIGTSLYYMVIGDYLFRGHGLKDVLMMIYNQKGRPDKAKDGEMYDLDRQYRKEYPESLMEETVAVYAPDEPLETAYKRLSVQTPNSIRDEVMLLSAFKTNPVQLEVVATVIDRMLDYNPETRMTVREALKYMAEEGLIDADEPVKSEKDLYNYYRLPTATMSVEKEDVEEAFEQLSAFAAKLIKASTITRETAHFVFDRACLYVIALLKRIGPRVRKDNLYAYTLMAYVIAANLFDSKQTHFTVADVEDETKIASKTLNRYLKYIVLADIELLGPTILDKLMKKLGSPYRWRAIKLNTFCLIHNLYHKFIGKSSVKEVIEFLIKFAKKDKEMSVHNLKKYFAKFIGE
jgi:serine/threonine protein kinase